MCLWIYQRWHWDSVNRLLFLMNVCTAFVNKIFWAWLFWESPNSKVLTSLWKLWWCKKIKRTVLCSIYKWQFKETLKKAKSKIFCYQKQYRHSLRKVGDSLKEHNSHPPFYLSDIIVFYIMKVGSVLSGKSTNTSWICYYIRLK
jgi:hypothetical protein